MLHIYTLGTEHRHITPEAHDVLAVKCSWKDEQEKALNLWADCFSPQDRIKYIRKNRRQFEFHDYRQMVDVVRGRCFTGCASDLVKWRRQFRVRAWRIAFLFCVAMWIAIILAVIRAAS